MPGELSEVRPRDQAEGPIANASFPKTPISAPQSGRGCRAENRLRPRFDRRRVSEQLAATTVGCWTARRRPRKHTSQQRLTVSAGRGKGYRDTVNRGNSGQPPELLQRVKNQPVVPDFPFMSSLSEAKDLPAIPQPHCPLTLPAFSQPVVPGQPGTHGGARDGRGYPHQPATPSHTRPFAGAIAFARPESARQRDYSAYDWDAFSKLKWQLVGTDATRDAPTSGGLRTCVGEATRRGLGRLPGSRATQLADQVFCGDHVFLHAEFLVVHAHGQAE